MAEFKNLPAGAPVAAQVTNWFENRFPTAFEAYRVHMSEYYAPKAQNIWYVFGALAILVLVMQIVTGIFLTMHYKPDAATAFESVEHIMRDVPGGWLIRYLHSTGASAFFMIVYLHMFRGLLYGSYRKPRELVWIFGCAIFLCMMAEGFFGYLLPWGQMSYWGAQVIINLFAAIPFVGNDLALLIRGDYVVGDATLNRFFAFHVIAVPLVLLGLVVAHLLALVKGKMSSVVKNGIVVAAAVAIVLLKTFDAKFWGVVVMGGAVMILFALPWLDHSPVKSIRYRPGWHTAVYAVFVVVFLILGWLGIEPVSPEKTLMAQIGTLYYFGFFLLMPWWSRLGEFKPVPERVVFHAH